MRTTLTLRHNGQRLRVPVDFNEYANVSKYFTLLSAVLRRETVLKTAETAEAADLYGQALTALYALVLGQSGCDCVLAWFGNDTKALCACLNPFLTNTVTPAIETASKRTRQTLRRDFIRAQRKAARKKA